MKLRPGLAVAIAIGATLVSLELVLRQLGFGFDPYRLRQTWSGMFENTPEATNRSEYDPDPDSFWVNKPGLHPPSSYGMYSPVNISSLGTRGPEPNRNPPPNFFRILCFGDSGTFGAPATDLETWPAHLQAILQQRLPQGPTVEVVNAGVCAYSTYQAAQLQKKLVPILKPHLVLWATGANDGRRSAVHDSARKGVSIRRSTSSLRMVQAAQWAALELGAMISGAETYPFTLFNVARVPPDEYEAVLSEVAADLHARGTPIVALCRGCDRERITRLHERGVVYYLSLEEYRSVLDVGQFLEGQHPPSETYHFIAERIADFLQRNGLVPSTGSSRSREDSR